MSFEQLNKIIRQGGAFFGWSIFVLLFAIPLFAERLPIKTYTVADGLLRDFINKIKQDSHGFLWFCTPGGVSRFDGYAFTNFTVADGLPVRQVNDFLETRGGDIWLASNAGLVKLNPKGVRAPYNSEDKTQNSSNPFFSVYLPKNPKAAGILVLYENKAGQLFAGTTDGLYKLNEQNELEEVNLIKPSGDILEIDAILEDSRGNLWIGTFENALLRILPDGQVEQFTMADGLPGKNIENLLEDKNGRIWVGMRSGLGAGLCLLVREPTKNQKVVERHYDVKDGLPAEWISSLYQTNDGQMWVGTIRGLCKWQGENAGDSVCKTYTAKNDLTDTEIWALTEDKDGNLWTGTRIGAKKLARYGFTAYTDADGIESPHLNSIFENAAGELFVSNLPGNTRTISRFNGERFDLVKPNFPPDIKYFGSGVKQTVRQDSAGDWWIPSLQGLFHFPRPAKFEDLAKSTPEQIFVGGKKREIERLFEDSRGDFWISTTNQAFELWRWERAANVWHDYTKEVGLNVNRFALVFAEDRNGHLWIGTSENNYSLIQFNYGTGQFKIFSEADGVPPGATNDLFIDSKGYLWLAKPGAGLLKLEDLSAEHLNFVRYSTAEGLSTQGAMCVTEDEFGRIYIGTGRGLDRLTPETGQIENFTTADGLPNSTVQMTYRDRKNNLWFITPNGLARFVPEPPRKREPPSVFITGVRVSGVPQAVSVLGEREIAPLELDSDQRQITVEFLGLGVNLGERLKYEYRFGESDWTRTDERTVNFANLAAGEYRFEVRTQTADRIYSQNPAIISFHIAAPFWQKWWFIAALLILTALVIYSLYRFRVSRLLEVANMRTRIATDLHDDIGANLTKIAILSEVAQQRLDQNSVANGKDNLFGSVAEISRESVSSMGDIVWAINPKKDSLIGLTRRMRQYAEEILERREIDLEFVAPTPATDLKLDANIRRNVYLIFKESINNIVRHSNAAAVKIEFAFVDKELVLQIGDDGIGFDATQEYDGNGLLNIKKRAEDCGGQLEIDSIEGAGTKIVMHLKLKTAAWSWR